MNLQVVAIRLAASVGAIAFAVGVSAVILLAVDVSPTETFSAMLTYGARVDSMISVVNRAVPLYLSALAVAVGFQMGLFNIGVEGQYRISSLIAASVGAAVVLPPVLHVALILAVAMAVGAAWASIAGVLKAFRGVHEVIATIMLNAIATGLGAWLLANFLRERVEGDLNIRTPVIADSGRLPSLNPVLAAVGIPVPSGSDLQSFLIVAVIAGIVYHVLIWKTRLGYDIRAFGANPGAAEASGVNRRRMILTTMAISGAFAGLVVMGPVLGFFGRYTNDLPSALGFTGIAVALVGRNKPVGMAFAALLFAYLNRSAQILDLRGIPKEIEVIIGGVIILAVVIAYEMARRFVEAQQLRSSAAADRQPDEEEVVA